MTSSSPYTCAAIIVAPHGIRGHVKVKSFLEDPTCLKAYSPFCTEQGEEEYKITKILSRTKDVLVVALEGIGDRTAAELVRGVKLMVKREQLPELAEDTFYHEDLLGLQVMSSQNQSLGQVHALFNFGAGDIMEIQTIEGKLEMFPFSRALVPEIDLQKGFLKLSSEGDVWSGGSKNGA